ncbi:PREDICTED: prothoracicotropic hormone-like [Eufriesea mexicana]|uniref:prothoracicotropic hormone-like n=1 Tax=Eufriesea mexicana TaxID=516756 RepID=UPI00083C33A8|nr:PREDICTED: prothoracicotropic hormone-like [Eufriesea mexicana]
MKILIACSCYCESQYELRDLGQGHYPRYLSASRCKKKTCRSKFYSCRLLHYVVHVLRLRETNVQTKDGYMMNGTLPEAPLPESLNRKWQLKPFLVAVACISDSDNKRY